MSKTGQSFFEAERESLFLTLLCQKNQLPLKQKIPLTCCRTDERTSKFAKLARRSA
jgi:hypothetical protein